MSLIVRLSAALGLMLAVACGWIYYDYQQFLDTSLELDEDRFVVVEPGMSGAAVTDVLVHAEIIDSPWYFRYFLWHSQAGTKIQPGSYRVDARLTPRSLAQAFEDGGRTDESRVSIPPGATIFDIADRLHSSGLADRESFLARVQEPAFCASLGVPAETLEGYLAPGRYVLRHGSTVDEIATEMHRHFRELWSNALRGVNHAALRAGGYGDHELVTLASMVEREAVLDRERGAIARVFLNRLGKEMKLQSDPTCVYPPLEVGEKPSPRRCRDPESRYSTYVIDGLPPGPIGAPSAASMKAVVTPSTGPDHDRWLYFVARNDGSWSHYFSATYEEHKKGVDFFLKKSRSAAPRGTTQPAGAQ